MITAVFVLVAIVLRLLAGVGYFLATVRGRVKPSAVSWFFWGITPMIAFIVQLNQHVGIQALSTLTLGITPFAIFFITVVKNKQNWQFTLSDRVCGGFAGLGLVLWLITENPFLALFFSIAADLFSAIPTIIKSIQEPQSEHYVPYFLSMLSMIVTLGAIQRWDVARYAFPVYMLLVNLLFVILIYGQVGPRWRAYRSSPQAPEFSADS
jgi:uncharacterized membrane protein (UPF0136 family)